MQRGRGKISKAAPAAAPDRDVAQYAEKDPTPLHKTFARWIVKEVGYDPDDAPSKRQAFLRGVSIATVARNAFTGSQYLADWREETGEAKRGPKPAAQKATTATKGRRKPAPEPEPEEVEDEAEWTDEDVDERQEELQGMTVAKLKAFAKNECEATAAELKGLTKKVDVVNFILDYEFPEDDEEESEEDEEDEDDDSEEDDDDDFEDDDDSEEDEDDFEDDVEEETPAPKSRARRGSTAKPSARTTPARRGKSAAGNAKSSKAKDDYLF